MSDKDQDESINFICTSGEDTTEAPIDNAEAKTEESGEVEAKEVIEGEFKEVEAKPENVSDSHNEQGKDKKPNGVQKRIDELTKEKAEYKRKFEAEQAKNKPVNSEGPEESNFENYDDYLTALDNYNVSLDENKQAVDIKTEDNNGDQSNGLTETQQKAAGSLFDRIDKATDKPDDFEAVALSNDVSITGEMVEALAECEDPIKVFYHLGKNKEVAANISNKTPAQQMKEILKLDMSVTSKPAKPAQITKANDVINPVNGTDSMEKDESEMSFSEFEAKDKARNKKRSNTW